MEWAFVAVLALGIPVGLAIWLIARAISAKDRIDTLSRRLEGLELEIYRLKTHPETTQSVRQPTKEAAPAPAPAPVSQWEAETTIFQRIPLPPTPAPPVAGSAPLAPVSAATPEPSPAAAPPPIPTTTAKLPKLPPVSEPPRETVPSINWEQFMGVKMFAWVGGLALFLGVAFFIKYSFDRNWISPEMRVGFGFIVALGLLVGGVIMSRKDYATLSQTLCATGVLILYAVTFSCRSIYHFQFFGVIPTFLLMVLITATAFLLAVRLDALVVAILGMLGGFLTPVLISEHKDNPFGLFGYIAILVSGVLLVAIYRRWFFLAALAALGTIIMQGGWANEFFQSERYFEGQKIFIALTVLLGFIVLYVAACWWAKARGDSKTAAPHSAESLSVEAIAANASRTGSQSLWWFLSPTLGLVGIALFFTAWFLTFVPLEARPWVMFGFVILVDLCVAALGVIEPEAETAHPLAGLAVFGLLAFWTARSLNNSLLNAALTFYFLFAVVHSGFPPLLQRWRGLKVMPLSGLIFPPLALVLVLIPLFQLPEVSFLVWPFVLLIDLIAIVLAVMSATVLPVVVVLLLTLCATAALIFKIPASLTGLPSSFFLLGAFATFFVIAGVWLARRFKPDAFTIGVNAREDFLLPENLAVQLPSFSAVLPFLLLMMATLRLPLANPAPVFGLALLLVVLLLGITRLFAMDWMPAIGLICIAALESAWHFNRFQPEHATETLIWYLLFLAVFTLFPFLFLRHFKDRIMPWAAAAMAGLPQFFLVHRVVKAAWPNDYMGLLPAAFAILPLAALIVVIKRIPATGSARMTQLAWYGGVGLFFVTLIFPIQFDREWITIGWALEGAALLWLFHRVPHPGLQLAGTGLLIAAFARLAVNPAVLEYHRRAATPIFNWYLYAYGIVTVCLFVAAWLAAPPRNRVATLNLPPVLISLGTILTFLLVNIEIADFFSAPGSTLTFEFSGNFARDMTYSIAWAMFALVLLVAGIFWRTAGARYSALVLLSVTLLKLFFHDLASLDQLYRIGAFVGVAVIAMLASFAYQRYFIVSAKAKAKAEG